MAGMTQKKPSVSYHYCDFISIAVPKMKKKKKMIIMIKSKQANNSMKQINKMKLKDRSAFCSFVFYGFFSKCICSCPLV